MPAGLAGLVPREADPPELAGLLARIEAAYRPAHVLLFGSRARGDARPDSDWDILVLLPAGAPARLLDPLLGHETQAGLALQADVLVAYLDEFVADAPVANTLAREIVPEAARIWPRPCPAPEK